MAERTFRLLTRDELGRVFEEHMKRDFPADELKPLSRLYSLMDRGEYDPYALFEDGELLAYALYWRYQDHPYVMLDYFAVVPERRNGGTGSQLLREMLDRFCQNGGGVFGEVEIPETGDEAVDALRRRRLGFYARAGLRQMGYRTKVFGVPYITLAYGPEVSDEELMVTHEGLYRSVFQEKEKYEANVFIPFDEG